MVICPYVPACMSICPCMYHCMFYVPMSYTSIYFQIPRIDSPCPQRHAVNCPFIIHEQDRGPVIHIYIYIYIHIYIYTYIYIYVNTCTPHEQEKESPHVHHTNRRRNLVMYIIHEQEKPSPSCMCIFTRQCHWCQCLQGPGGEKGQGTYWKNGLCGNPKCASNLAVV